VPLRPGKTLDKYGQYFHDEGSDWHRTRESAVERAESMRKKKLVSLEASLKKFKNLAFT
jgi:hypothetical protein